MNKLLALIILLASCTTSIKKPEEPKITEQAQNIQLPPVGGNEVLSAVQNIPKASPMVSIYPSGGGGKNSRKNKPKKTVCGDGSYDPNEQCDDGNKGVFDGCSSCKIEPGFPLCTWQCDDPACTAVCEPVCKDADCQIQCGPPPSQPNCNCTTKCDEPECEVRCPTDMCETEHCPPCETVCEPATCTTSCKKINPSGPDCQNLPPTCSPLCEAPQCAWNCQKPQFCPKPNCELQCERVTEC